MLDDRPVAPAAWGTAPAGYLDTATIGIPCPAAVEATRAAVEAWAGGRVDGPGYDAAVTRSRTAFARLVGVPAADVAIGATVSGLVGLIAASLPAGSRVLVAEGDFTSVLFPFLAQAQLEVRAVALEDLVDAIDARTDLVAVSAAQSADGRLVDQDALARAGRHHGARTLLDVTQAAGWLPVDGARFDAVVCGTYKWLCAPRGSSLLYVDPAWRDALVPAAAGWYAGDDPWASCYGTPLALAPDARRLDTSPAWITWAGTAPALELAAELDLPAIRAHDVALADALRTALGLEPAGSAIVSLAIDDGVERLRRAGVRAAGRAGRVRLAPHRYTTWDDVDRAVGALRT